ncbi:hypothetical protein [Actinocrinis sp.]|uniref:hypothetical protein n=1 Tax=Actinocrinis sp. TaxID=1920516 RepID=UPI002BE35BB8|nr:hypothetical protein [Actinocrinis sp.]HXR69510.1 hypothetical protein [Actinocrinis sp.]
MFVFFFAKATSAQQTFAWLQSQYGPSRMPGSGMTITKTARHGQIGAARTDAVNKNSLERPPASSASHLRYFSTYLHLALQSMVHRRKSGELVEPGRRRLILPRSD